MSPWAQRGTNKGDLYLTSAKEGPRPTQGNSYAGTKISRNSPYQDRGQSETRRCLVLLCKADGKGIQLLPTFTKGGKALGLREKAVLRTNAWVQRLGTGGLSNQKNKICRQCGALEADLEEGDKVYFTSSDRLLRLCSGPELGPAALEVSGG